MNSQILSLFLCASLTLVAYLPVCTEYADYLTRDVWETCPDHWNPTILWKKSYIMYNQEGPWKATHEQETKGS